MPMKEIPAYAVDSRYVAQARAAMLIPGGLVPVIHDEPGTTIVWIGKQVVTEWPALEGPRWPEGAEL